MKPNHPLVLQVSVSEDDGVGLGSKELEGTAVVGSSHPPNQPGCLQLEEGDTVGCDDVVVMEGAGAGAGVADG